MMLISMTSTFARNENCPVREIGDGLVIMAPDGETTHSLENVGAFIWRQLDRQKTLADVLDAVTEEYAVSPEVAEADLRVFVNELLASDIIVQL